MQGDIFGEMSLEKSHFRDIRVVAATDCHFATLKRSDYKKSQENLKKLYEQLDIDFL